MDFEDGYFDAKTLAEYLGIKLNTVRQYVSRDKIPYFKMPGSRSVRFRKAEIDAWMRQGFKTADGVAEESCEYRG